jgi:hypothetical protein
MGFEDIFRTCGLRRVHPGSPTEFIRRAVFLRHIEEGTDIIRLAATIQELYSWEFLGGFPPATAAYFLYDGHAYIQLPERDGITRIENCFPALRRDRCVIFASYLKFFLSELFKEDQKVNWKEEGF